jgi:co-chaperonin GroES (HSP10)
MDQLEQYDMNGKPIRRPKAKTGQRGLTFPKIGAGALAVLVIAGGGFYGGMQYQKNHQPKTSPAAMNTSNLSQNGGSEFGRFRSGFGNGVIGSVTAISSSSITVDDQRSDSSKTYAITSTTTITADQQTVDTTDIKVGDTVIITASSGSSDATRIIVRPSTSAPQTDGTGAGDSTNTDGSGVSST